jgi:predicted ABC-type ATPase
MSGELVLELDEILSERMYKVGTVRKWKDGTKHMKVASGQWVEVPEGHSPASGAPEGHELKGATVFPGVGIIPDKGPWINELPGLPKDTQAANYIQGKNADGTPQTDAKGNPIYAGLKPERQKLHTKIEDSFLSKVKPVPPNEKPVAILMMGGPASGKSSMVRALGTDESTFVAADADAVKEQIPEYRKAVSARARNAAAMVHEESSDIVKKVRAKAIDQNKNLIVDGTGAKADSYISTIKKLKEKGYHTNLMLADMDPDVALPRAKARAEKTGRYVPDSFITDAYPKIPGNFMQVAKLVDEFAVYDTRGKPPKLVWSKANGVEKIHDEEWHKKFLAKTGASKESLDFHRNLTILRNVIGERSSPETRNMNTKTKSKPNGKKPNVSSTDIHKRIATALDGIEAELDKLPKKFKPGEGVREVPSDLDD